MKNFFIVCLLVLAAQQSYAQSISKTDADSLKSAIFNVNTRVNDIQLNLEKGSKTVKMGILVSAIGYSVTIIGGQLLGGPNNDTGEILLYAGGAIGLGGTVMMFKGFDRFRSRSKRSMGK